MRSKLENRLEGKLAAILPEHVVKCSYGADGIVAVAIEKPATKESWWITGIAMQSLIRKETLTETAEQILVEVNAASGGGTELLADQAASAQ
ncbi:hypothetical protein SA496_13700 [Pseudomonas sp. JS3066]|uniref:hypothetical protein n=1 Tax=unclassified Pseudomonas TaxID=196821 RepID=UPI000EA97EFD|nr:MULTISPECIES: hypothetical protein [unclassified Pseudomonas]AYF86383.1 hypothetical protein D6Z43_04090 [Pseudomonas sp. DY-1]WVK96162.1 hypothetical protein SA496_13700 [Pseudomonas sp. JS3066]